MLWSTGICQYPFVNSILERYFLTFTEQVFSHRHWFWVYLFNFLKSTNTLLEPSFFTLLLSLAYCPLHSVALSSWHTARDKAKDYRENKNLTCRKCTTQSCQFLRTSYQETPNILLIQINRFSISNLHGRPRKK